MFKGGFMSVRHVGFVVVLGLASVWSGGASAEDARALDARGRKLVQKSMRLRNEANEHSRGFANAITQIEGLAQQRAQAEQSRAGLATTAKVYEKAAVAQLRKASRNGRREVTWALGSYDEAAQKAGSLAHNEATMLSIEKAMPEQLDRLLSSATDVKGSINRFAKTSASLDKVVRSMQAKKLNPALLRQWQQTAGKVRSDRDRMLKLKPVIDKRVGQARKLAHVPSLMS
jgi:hypothetical protein